jgi:hypothetical protein
VILQRADGEHEARAVGHEPSSVFSNTMLGGSIRPFVG